MCGICGVIGGDPRQAEPAVRRMMRAMEHRGPDGEGCEKLPCGAGGQGPAVTFGFRRLAIIDLTATGHQPMFHPDTGDCLVFNGEIYNFKSLRAQLQCDGVRFRGTSDTEVLLKALSTWGHAALARLRGMYAFAFFEAKSRRVLLARDPLGIKPLYVATGRQGLVFASEVRAVLSSGLVSTDLDPAGVATALAYGAPQDPLTVHRDVMSFPAGGYAWVPVDRDAAPRSPDVRRFWAFPRDADADPLPLQAASDLRSLLESAVAQHLVADRPIGLFLSAGIDSFSIAAVAKSARADIKSFTVGFADRDIVDEVDEAESAARALGIEHRRIILSSADVEPMWNAWLHAADRPSIDGFNTFVVSRAVRDAGKTVALSGLGGDELFGGYPNFRSARRYAAILSAMGPVPRVMRAAGVRWLMRGRSRSFLEKAEELVSGGAGFGRVALRLRRILTDRQIRDLGIDIPSLPLDEHVLSPMALAAVGAGDRSEPFNLISRLECGLYMGNTLLRDTDVVSMAHSLEVRVPLLDQSVVDYVLPLSERLKVSSGGPPKHLLRAALRGLIPNTLLNRPKTGFSLPIHRWMHGALRESCEAAIGHLAGSGVLDAAAVRRIWGEFIGSADSVNWTRPMTLVALGNYLRNVPAGA